MEWLRLWIRTGTLNREIPGSNLVAVVPLDKALCPLCLVPLIGLQATGPLVVCLKAACFLSGHAGRVSPTTCIQWNLVITRSLGP